MTDLIVPRGDTFPRAFLETYRASKNTDFYSDLSSSKSDELVLQNSADIPIAEEIQHGHSENLLDSGCMSPTQEDFLDKSDVILPKTYRNKRSSVYDRVDPEDSIRDIVSENDFYRFVLFKKHYDKYLHLSQKYEEARNIAYYLEEKYHEVKTERDDLIQQRDELARRLESNECLIREKEDEVFLHLERVVYLEEQCDKIRAEKEKLLQKKNLIEIERDRTLRLLQGQARESECNRRKLERARQEVVHHLTRMKNEKESLERENDQLKEALEAERKGARRYLTQVQRRRIDAAEYSERRVAGVKPVEYYSSSLASQFQKAVEHLANCKQKKCSVCAYAKSSYKRISPSHHRYERKLFGCLQTPFLEMRNMIKPPRSPINSGEGESLSEWFCPVEETPSGSGCGQSECSSLSVPFAELAISYMDDVSDSSSGYLRDKDDPLDEMSQGNRNSNSFRGFGSDSGFSSEICGEYKSNATTPKEKFCPPDTLDENDCAKLTRTKWTASFRKIIRKIRK
ncbi:FK506-binding protein 15-like [Sitophilus oryzae]|uniref:FK506-binding protein 15-like n=1 Tax=Sitophilus oryzae TaxID=7048 RepID=A0A6J2YFT3_SITOR|nr:FK506-binding protein 15-like [Sitophilus oryzae]